MCVCVCVRACVDLATLKLWLRTPAAVANFGVIVCSRLQKEQMKAESQGFVPAASASQEHTRQVSFPAL